MLAAIATLGTMLLTPAAAYAFHFLKFRFRRLLLIIIINAFVLPQQVVIIPLFQLWRQTRADRQLSSRCSSPMSA